MRKPGIVRECEHPGSPHSHGEGCYRFDRCRCPVGRAWSAREARERRKRQLLGTWQPKYVPAVGVVRRMEALATLGYDLTWQARQVGVSRKTIEALTLHNQQRVRREVADRVARLYEQHWDKPRVGSSKSENIAAAMTRNRAARRGYLPPAAWDDETIDDPQAEPSLLAVNPGVLPVERRIMLALQVMDLGFTQKQASDRARIAPVTLRKALRGEGALHKEAA